MICPCGGSCTSSDVADGTAYTCRACGRREVLNTNVVVFKYVQPIDVIPEIFSLSMEPVEMKRKKRG